MINDMESILLTEQQIRERVAQMGAEISRDYADKDPLFVGVLKGCFVFMAAIQSFFAGMILNTLRQKERQDFEMELHRVGVRPETED